MAGALDVLPLTKAKEHLNREKLREPGGDDELIDWIGAAVRLVAEHLGRPPEPGHPLHLAAAKVALAEMWKTQRPGGRTGYAGQVGPNADDGPTSGASIESKLAVFLGPKVRGVSVPLGLFPAPTPWPDPIERAR